MGLELWLCAGVWIGHSVYALVTSWRASFEHKGNGDLWTGFFEPGWRILGGRRKDSADFEWHVWTGDLGIRLLLSVLHSIVFNLVGRYLSGASERKIMLAFWLTLHLYLHGFKMVMLTGVHGLILVAIVKVGRRRKGLSQVSVWVSSICMLCALVAGSDAPVDDYEQAYVDAVLIAYKLLQYISYCLFYLEESNEREESFTDSSLNLFYYAFYWPYSVVLIVSYKGFRAQLAFRDHNRPELPEISFDVLRFCVWATLSDFIRHYVYVNSFMNQPVLLEVLSLPVLCSIGYVSGQLFHVKYMAIFGFPRIFGRLDGMSPPELPVCISRISLYSRMWRYFDRGLYEFMKDNIFIPVAGPSFTFPRRIIATTLSFSFVFLWHGASRSFLCWVTLNLIEIFLENGAKELVKLPCLRTLISRLPPAPLRRITALLHVPCTALGILAIFFFLGDNEAETGWVFFERIILGQFLTLGTCFWYTIALGYCYAQCCLEVEQRLGF